MVDEDGLPSQPRLYPSTELASAPIYQAFASCFFALPPLDPSLSSSLFPLAFFPGKRGGQMVIDFSSADIPA